MPLDQNPHQTVTRLECVGVSIVDFLCPKCDNFACLHSRQDQNELHLKMIFFAIIAIFCKPTSQRYSSIYTTIFVRRKDKTNYLSNQTWVKCCHSRNKQKVKWRTLYISGGTYSLKSTSDDRFFEKLFMRILFTLRVVARNQRERERGSRRRNILFFIFRFVGDEPWSHV